MLDIICARYHFSHFWAYFRLLTIIHGANQCVMSINTYETKNAKGVILQKMNTIVKRIMDKAIFSASPL